MSAPTKPNVLAPSENCRNGGRIEDCLIKDFAQFRARFSAQFGADHADDILQESYIRARSETRVANIDNPRSYIFRIARNISIDIVRRAKHESCLCEAQAVFAAEPIQDEASHFKALLAELPASLRDVLILNHIYGYTHREIADRFGISVKAVEKRMQKAMALCAAKLKD